MKESEKLGISCWKRAVFNLGARNYHPLLEDWWNYFGLTGDGLLMGEPDKKGEKVKIALMEMYPSIKSVQTVDLKKADIIWDITTPSPHSTQYNWIICQSVLEHVVDPVSAMKNMVNILLDGSNLYVHTPAPTFQYHSEPIDCYRFFRDAFVSWVSLTNTTLLDYFEDAHHCVAAYKRNLV